MDFDKDRDQRRFSTSKNVVQYDICMTIQLQLGDNKLNY